MACEAAPSAPDILGFQLRTGVDDRSLQGLLELSPGDQMVVMDIVESQACKNPSAVTWSSVRQCKSFPQRLRLEYITRNIDERATEAMGKLSPEVQEQIAMSVDVSKCRNLSAFVWSQVRNSTGDGRGPHAAAGAPRPHRVAGIVPAMPPLMASALMRHDRSRTPRPTSGRAAVYAPGGSYAPDVGNFAALLDDGAAKALAELSPSDQRIVHGLVTKQECRNPSAVTWSMVKAVKERPAEMRMEYFKHYLDEGALEALHRLSPEEMEEIFSQVDLSKCRNLSAFIWSRVKGVCPPPGGGGQHAGQQEAQIRAAPPAPLLPQPLRKNVVKEQIGAAKDDYEDFGYDPIAEAGLDLDQRCLTALQQLSPAQQVAVLSEVQPSKCRNVSAFVWSKIRQLT